MANQNNTQQSNNKSTKYIIGFTAIIIIAILIFVISQNTGKNNNTTNTPSAQQAVATNNKPDTTKGSIDTTIEADIQFRDVDFSLTEKQVKKKEKKLEDTLDDPTISESSDGYKYITYSSNPENPLSYNGFTVSTEGTSCLTYVFHNDKLDEVRLQFGAVDETTASGILGSLKNQYGESTFYRSTSGVETYWWKTDSNLLMLNKDSAGTTLFFRQN